MEELAVLTKGKHVNVALPPVVLGKAALVLVGITKF